MQNCMIAQSGGPTVAINASLAGIIAEASKFYDTVYGSLNGIIGVLDNRTLNLSERLMSIPNFLDTLKVTPAMYLGSCRFKMPETDTDSAIYEQIFSYFKKNEIKGFFYIGGNDSMDTVLKLSAYARANGIDDISIMGVPKTIDNDLVLTDHTPGFGSATKYIATTMQEIAYDTSIYPIPSITIVEIMGRDAGWLTAAASLASTDYGLGPDLIYLPEVAFNTKTFLEDVKTVLQKKKNILIAISEGIRDEDGNYISATSEAVDSFGHNQLSGAGKILEYLIADAMDIKVRSIELNLPQRCAAHLSSMTDLEEAFALGETAVKAAKNGKTGQMSIINRVSNSPYVTEYDTVDIARIANKVKSVPRDFINETGNYVTQKMITYLSPLIVGEPVITYENGLPQYLDIKHLY